MPAKKSRAAAVAPPPCPACGGPLASRYCGHCGEKRLEPGDLRLAHLARELWEHATSLDSRLARTLVTLVRRPGLLVGEYARGARTRYVRPLQLYLLVNVAFFLLAPHLGLFHYRYDRPPDPAALARQGTWLTELMLTRIARVGSAAEAVRRFNATVELHMSVVFGAVVIPLLGLILLTLHARRRRYAVEHFVLGLHLATVWMLALGTVVGLARLAERVVPALAGHLFAPAVAIALALTTAHVALALRRVYGEPWPYVVAKSVALGGGFFYLPMAFFLAVSTLTWWLI
jgi:hypothetical protein